MTNKQLIKEILSEDNIIRICVWDFDGTLVDSPVPDIGRDVYHQKTGQPWPHKGWWGKEDSLNMDIFDMPPMESVIADYRIERAKPNTLMVMLTGRIPKLAKAVENILKAHNLTFDKYIYNNGGSTIVSKIASLDKLMQEYPNVKSVAMWEDRGEHIEAFKAWGAAQEGVEFNLTFVEGNHHK